LSFAKNRIYYGWIVVVTCLAIGIVSYGIHYSYGVFFKSLEQHFEWSRTLTSGVFSSYMLVSCAFAILGGWALDRYGPRIVVMVMGFFTGLSLLLTSQANVPWHLFVSYSVLLAIGIGPTYTVTMANASRWFSARRGLALGIVGAGAGSGIIVMSPIAARLVSSYGWQNAYAVMGIVALGAIIPLALLLRSAPTTPAVPQDQAESGHLSLLQAARTRNFWLFLLVWFSYSFCLHLLLVHLPSHATDMGVSSIKAATILGLVGGISVPSRIFMGRLSDTIGRKRAGVICALGMGGAMLLLVGGSDLWVFYVFAVTFGLFYGGIDPPVIALIGDVFGTRYIGVIIGVLVIGWSTGAAIGPALAGYIFDVNGSYLFAFVAAAVVMLMAAVSIFLIKRPA